MENKPNNTPRTLGYYVEGFVKTPTPSNNPLVQQVEPKALPPILWNSTNRELNLKFPKLKDTTNTTSPTQYTKYSILVSPSLTVLLKTNCKPRYSVTNTKC